MNKAKLEVLRLTNEDVIATSLCSDHNIVSTSLDHQNAVHVLVKDYSNPDDFSQTFSPKSKDLLKRNDLIENEDLFGGTAPSNGWYHWVDGVGYVKCDQQGSDSHVVEQDD